MLKKKIRMQKKKRKKKKQSKSCWGGEVVTVNSSNSILSSQLISDSSNVLYNIIEPILQIRLQRKRERNICYFSGCL